METTEQKGIVNITIGWKCACGVHRNRSIEAWADCLCGVEHTKESVEKSNNEYWKKFWR